MGTGDYPHGLRTGGDWKSIYVANVEEGMVSLSEPDGIEVGSAPAQGGFTPDESRVCGSLRNENKAAVIDSATREVTARVEVGRAPIRVHASPAGAFSRHDLGNFPRKPGHEPHAR